jgi:hypothetical protein
MNERAVNERDECQGRQLDRMELLSNWC